MADDHMLALGHTALAQVKSLSDLLSKSNFPQPASFSRDIPATQQEYPTAIQDCRMQLLETLDELRAVILGPTSYVFHTCVLNVSRRSLYRDAPFPVASFAY